MKASSWAPLILIGIIVLGGVVSLIARTVVPFIVAWAFVLVALVVMMVLVNEDILK